MENGKDEKCPVLPFVFVRCSVIDNKILVIVVYNGCIKNNKAFFFVVSTLDIKVNSQKYEYL